MQIFSVNIFDFIREWYPQGRLCLYDEFNIEWSKPTSSMDFVQGVGKSLPIALATYYSISPSIKIVL